MITILALGYSRAEAQRARVHADVTYGQPAYPVYAEDPGYAVPANLPPGQAKKLYGAQSARDFAPGHMKKFYGERSARDFAPGQMKKREREYDDEDYGYRASYPAAYPVYYPRRGVTIHAHIGF